MPLGIDPTVDYVFKRLFADPANKDLLIHLLNAVLQTSPPIVDVVILNPFNEKEYADDKLSVLDIKARSVGEAWFNIEIQNRVYTSLRPRLAYYGARLYVEQLSEGDDYSALLPAITICFLKEALFRELAAPHLRFALRDCEHGLELTNRLQVHIVELAKYNSEGSSPESSGGLAQWAFFLNHAAQLKAEDLKRLLPQREFVKATGVVEMIAQTPEQRMQYEARRKAELDYQACLADERREGQAEGRTEVIAEMVQTFQELLQEPISPRAQLMALTNDALTELRDALKMRLKNRG
jgi:predicted transposase/invertase (TIGR01784 family)